MGFEARIIEALQSLSSTLLDYIVYALTFMGDELFFVLVAAVIFWCFSKRFGFRFLNVYLLSAGCNEGLKAIFKRPRPFETYDGIRSIFKRAHGWSFPSGHSNSIAVIGTQISQKAIKEKSRIRPTLILSLSATLIVMISRMYLGQHYLTDVVAGAGFGALLAIFFSYIFSFLEEMEDYFWVVVLPLSIIVTVILIITGVSDSTYHVIRAFAAYAGIAFAYPLEKKLIDYNVKSGKIYKQLIKVMLGLTVTLLLLLGLSALLGSFIPAGSVLEAIFIWYLLYFLVGVWVALGAPLVFKKLGL